MINDNSPSALEHAKTLLSSGKIRDAQKVLWRIIKSNPQDMNAWVLFVNSLSDDSQKILALQRCIQYNPDNPKVKQALAKLLNRVSQKNVPDALNVVDDSVQTKSGKNNSYKLIAVGVVILIFCLFLPTIVYFTTIRSPFSADSTTVSNCRLAESATVDLIRKIVKEVNPNYDVGMTYSIAFSGRDGWYYVASHIIPTKDQANMPLIGSWMVSPTNHPYTLNDTAATYSFYRSYSKTNYPEIAPAKHEVIEEVENCVYEYVRDNSLVNLKTVEQPGILTNIPGVSYSDVSRHLQKLGISCESNQPLTVTHTKKCYGNFENGTVIVEVDIASPEDPEKIIYIYAEVDQYDKAFPSYETAAKILSEIAAISYTNSSPDEARDWVLVNVPLIQMDKAPVNEPRTEYGDVNFTLTGLPPESIWLLIESFDVE